MSEPVGWGFGRASAAEFIARTSWPMDTEIEKWAGRLLTEPDLLDAEFKQARARVLAAYQSLAQPVSARPRYTTHDHKPLVRGCTCGLQDGHEPPCQPLTTTDEQGD